jgi:hypothetical protein
MVCSATQENFATYVRKGNIILLMTIIALKECAVKL